jgi:hypothetical protein
VSTNTNPVTHTADIVVNSAVTHPAAAPSAVATGSISTTMPTATAAANPTTTAAAGRRKTASTGDRRPGIALATPGRIGPAHRRDRVTTIHGPPARGADRLARGART